MYEWNPIYNLVMKIKRDYYNEKQYFDTYNFEIWIKYLYNKEFNDVFNSLLYIEDKYKYLEQLDCLQFVQYENYLLIRYGISALQKDFWTNKNSIYKECRSVVIELEKEELVLTPFRKFYNLNEVEENSLQNIQERIKRLKTQLDEISLNK
jgi:hypothetical protein